MEVLSCFTREGRAVYLGTVVGSWVLFCIKESMLARTTLEALVNMRGYLKTI
jgi:hypothetical protein